MQPHVRVWDSKTFKTIAVIGIGEFDRAVACVCFSKVTICNFTIFNYCK